MRTLIAGGAACGKSEYAESLAVAHGGPLIYIATMQPFGGDARQKIARHQKLRAGKGFESLECYTDLAGLVLPERGTVLLECMSNLCANELFADGAAFESAFAAVKQGIAALERQANHLVVVSGDVMRDGGGYPEETMQYIELLGKVNVAMAARFERVAEVVCGIPVWRKGGANESI